MKKVISLIIGLFSFGVVAQNQNCCANITTIYSNQTLLNTFYPPQLNQSIPSGSNTIALDAVPTTDIYGNSFGDTPIQAGDLVLIIQMQGAAFNAVNSPLYGAGLSSSGPDGLGASGFMNLENTGNYEFVIALNDVPLTGGVLEINGACNGGIINSYDNLSSSSNSVLKSFQVIRVPRYENLTLQNNVVTTAWNGRVGGVIAFDVLGVFNLNGFSIDASGRGFRGGFQNVRPSSSNNNVITTSNNSLSSGKGEGISGTPRYMWNGINAVDYGVGWVGYPGGDYGRGAPANAGGGGNIHNAGGGGGGNGGAGGVGGNGHAGSGNPATFPNGGRMGSSIIPNLTTVFMGGGGGGGDANNATTGVKGGPGGGIIILTLGTIQGTGQILSNGFTGEPGAFFGAPDGAGGGGAGGSILIITNEPSTNANLTIEVKGGKGGNTLNDLNDSHGPGGGGGGGVLMHNITDALLNIQLQAGQNGLTGNGLGVAHGASAGQQGVQIIVDSAESGDLIVDLLPNPIAFFEAPSVCVGQSFEPINLSSVVTIQNSALVSYLWDFGDGSISNEVSPTHIFTTEGTYTVSLQVTTNWGCTDNFNALIEVTTPTVPIFDQISPVNSGEAFTLSSLSLNGINGTWTPEINNLQTTTYTFIPDGTACVVEVSMTVQVLNACDTSGWTSSFRYLNPPDQIVPFHQAIHPDEGLMYLNPNLATSSYYWSKFEYVPEEPICVPNNFYFEFKINSNSPLGIPAYDTTIEINATGGTSWMILMGQSWGQPWTQLGVNDNLLLSNAPALIFPSILDWSTIKMEYNNGFLNYYVNNLLFFSGPYEGNVCNINSFSISFKGSGSVDYVKVANLNNQIIYLEEFDDCENMSTFPDLCDIQPVIVLSSNTPDCNAPTLELTVDVDLDVQNLSFLWTGPNGFTSNEQNPIISNIDNSFNGLYTCAVQTNSCNSVEVQSIEITNININPIIEPEFLLDTQICFGANLSELPTISDNGITGTWSPALDNTATTTYTFTPDVGQCATTALITITLNPISAPSGASVQVFCASSVPTIQDLIVTGDNIQWYDQISGGIALSNNDVLVDGTTYYATQTLGNCESNERLAVTVLFNDPQITASQISVCNGTEITLSVNINTFPITDSCTLPHNLQNGLIGYFPFCGNANDESGNSHNGLVNGSVLTTDRFNNPNTAYQFNSNASITPANLETNVKNSFTYSAWIFPNNNIVIPTPAQIFNQGSNLPNNTCVIHPIHGSSFGADGLNAGSGLYVGINGLYVLEHSHNWEAVSLSWQGNLSGWHLITIVYENKIPKLYLDGEFLVSGIPSPRDIYISLGPDGFTPYINSGIGAGYRPNPLATFQFFNGKIDDLAFYNRILSDDEILQLYSPAPTYLWSTGETTPTINSTPTATTTYWVEVTVNGVTCRKEIIITVNPNLTPTFTQVADFCSGSSLSALPTTSNNGITGTWTPALNNTATTTYTFTPDAGQCATTASMTMTVNPNITPTFTQVSAICSGATFASLPTISNNGYTGTWSPALNNTVTTSYTFTPDVGQCATIANITITVNPLPLTPTGNSNQSFCAIDNPTVSDLVGSGSNILWYQSASVGSPLSLNFDLIDGMILYASSIDVVTNCENPTRFPVTIQVENPILPSISSEQVFCLESNLTLADINTNGTTINWYDSAVGGNLVPLTQILNNGDVYYGASVSSISGCESTTRIPLEITIIDSNLSFFNLITIDDNDLNKELIIQGIEQFPNNAIEIYNRYGNLVWSGINYDNVSNTFKGMASVSGVVSQGSYLPTGTYFFILSYPNDCEKSELKGFIQIDNKR